LLWEIANIDIVRGRIDKARGHLEDILILHSDNRRVLRDLIRMNYLVSDDSTPEVYLERLFRLGIPKEQLENAIVYYYAAEGYREK
jgi:hypothetical protein